MAANLTQHLRGGKQVLQKLDAFSTLSPVVTRVLGQNPGSFTLNGTNTYLIGSGPKRILWDTGEGLEDYVETLRKAMSEVGCTGLQAIVISHWHFDHLGGVPSVVKAFSESETSPVPVYKFIPEELEPSYGGEGAVTPYEIWPKDKFTPLGDGDVLRTEGATLRVYLTPGHANDHLVGVIEEEQSMLSADNVLGEGTGVFRDLTAYLASLQRMKDLKPQKLYPGHGPVIEDAIERIDAYVEHRMGRVRQVEGAMRDAGQEAALTVEQITRAVYPSDLDPKLFGPAMYNTVNVLTYLSSEKRAEKTGPEPKEPFTQQWKLCLSASASGL
ncbi:Lactamase-like protein nscB [Hondaea fermentalgiana]|uniref:Lactamase-like protein nscB n=1 Tax=Hondaea fermentalgiana TaxID=2315210 RepID=A0A2R5GXJ5_9STRA|nr:Lactamase-like protein nscB [Hondaea fermentalgiana]|eukprot:GBG35049.1 Lactamase-like protein nscB [Hondaea fermentalgiana]